MSLFTALQASVLKLTALAEKNSADLADTKNALADANSALGTVQAQLAALQASGGLSSADAADLQALQDTIDAEVAKLSA